MNCLIVGGGGFIGAYTSRILLKEGYHVVIWDAQIRENSLYRILDNQELGQLTLINGDLTDFSSLLNIIKEYKIESIIALASWQIPACQKNPTRALIINGLGFNYILEAAALMGIRRVVWTSSNAVFGLKKDHPVQPVPNNDFHKPNTVYGALKSLNEYMADHFYQNRNVDSIGLRFSLVYGYGRLRGASAFASEMIEKAVTGEPCVVENGDTIIDWLYVIDAANLILEAMKIPRTTSRVFNTHGELHSISEAVNILIKLVPSANLIVKNGVIDANWYLDSSQLEREIGFKPSYSLQDGLQDALLIAREKLRT